MDALERALLADIVANLDDDTPRLVYADLLDERGEEKTAAFIRLQVERARLDDWEPRAFDLDEEIAGLAEHAPKVLMAPWPWGQVYRRGFVSAGVMVSDVWSDDLPPTALADLTFSGRSDWPGIARRPFMAQVRTIRLPVFPLDVSAAPPDHKSCVHSPALSDVDDLAALLNSPHLGALRSLDLGDVVLGGPTPWGVNRIAGWWHAGSVGGVLSSWPGFSRLTELRLAGLGFVRGELDAWEGITLPRLRSLDLLGTGLPERELILLAVAGLFRELRTLRVNSGGERGVLAALGGVSQARLVELDLTDANIFRSTLETIPDVLAGLRSLVLDDNSLQAVGVMPRIPEILPTGLRRLSLRECRLGDADANDLARWPGLAGVTMLDLSRNRFGKRGTWALAVSPHLENVRRLVLEADSGPAAKELERRFGARWVRYG